jgi:hypothetical protein
MLPRASDLTGTRAESAGRGSSEGSRYGERGTDSRRFLRVTGNLDVILQPGQPGAGGVFSVADGDPKPQFSRTRISTKWPEKTVHTREHENGNGSFLRLYPERSPRK